MTETTSSGNDAKNSPEGRWRGLVKRWMFAVLVTCGPLLLFGASRGWILGVFFVDVVGLFVLIADVNRADDEERRSSPPQVDVDAVVAGLAKRIAGRQVIVGIGCWCGFAGYVRAGVVTADDGDAGSMCWEGYLPEGDLAVLRQKLSSVTTVRPGTIDFYHATRWSLAWTDPSGEFLLVDRRGIKVRVDDEVLVVSRRLRGDLRIHRSRIRRICARVSESWTRLTVIAETDRGEVTLVSSRSWAPYYDVCYDGIDLMADTIWLESLAESLAQSLAVPVDLPKV
ncbi:hypothetical protein FIV42_20785 [Persicimonas caeni]|uniref:Uncharacterized protein n=1 Tax=Persicimonas caeni TaxID=2292766 RepID=A0A4Y6PXN4_PERCE|nr:hypothetical protein [Persicimonas caeni]QDG53092.1 hypothetical protein FIV42_20785 [Persicimonas caeni]QED34314.1 hypothetical protein FRD00_20780 [Persicimonas caeni]